MSHDVRALTADGVVLVDDEVVLLERNHSPDEGSWVLPGGFVEPDETAATAAAREVEEEIGMAVDTVGFVGLFDAPDRDPRHTATAAYVCEPVDATATPEAREEATRVDTFDPRDPPELGFDHADVLDAALDAEFDAQ
ncbi:NUDIX domain-containing protein [Halorubellus sp. PRR65]|uniref:NUDIX domain-containing protein n=1 Tax=Halorubellus sp. PRR65 TaxID=3098148 RepID=UPI002B2624E0|nr:NUDIX domain-containing protein [Halorubellus sp. PRR65]